MEASLGRTNATVLPALLLGALLASCGKPLASKPSSPRAPDVTAKIAVESYFPLTDQSQWTYRVQDFVKKLAYLSKVRVHGRQFVDSLKRDGIGVEERYSSFGPGGPYILEEQEPILYFHENGYLNRILLTYQAGKVVAASGSGDTQFLPEALTWGAGHGGLLGGKTIYRDVMSMPTFLCVRARDAQHAVAVGTCGAIASTSDGVNWTWNQVPGNAPLYDIRALPDGDYLVVGASGALLRGNPESGWKPADVPAGVFTWLSASDFDAAGHGVAGGGHGLLLTTGDFGEKWEWKANG